MAEREGLPSPAPQSAFDAQTLARVGHAESALARVRASRDRPLGRARRSPPYHCFSSLLWQVFSALHCPLGMA